MSFYIRYVALVAIAISPSSLATSLFPDSFLEKGSNEPEFVENIRNVTVPAGREAVLSCVVSNLGKYKVGWIRAEDQTILTLDSKVVTHNGRVLVTHDGLQTWNLHLRQIRETDRDDAIMKKQLGCVDVHVSPTIIDEDTSTDLTIREGDNVTLICKASGRPKPKIIWKREDGEKIIMRRGLRDVYKGYDNITGETLQFIRLDRRQMAIYYCIAANDVPPAKSKRIVLDVNFPPLIKVPSQLLGAPFGTDLKLRCEIQAMPKPFVYWVKNRGEMLIDGLGLRNSTKYAIEETRHSYKVSTSLTIRNFGPSDVGIFNCVATTSMGKAEGSIRLHEIKLQNKGTSSTATENHHPVTLSGLATASISTEGRNIGKITNPAIWTPYDIPTVVLRPHQPDPKSEIDSSSSSSSQISFHGLISALTLLNILR